MTTESTSKKPRAKKTASTKTAPTAAVTSVKATASAAKTKVTSLGASARQTAEDLRRASSEALGEARGVAHDAIDRAGRIGRDVYLAGLGAVAATGERGRTLFDELVREGEKIASRDLSKPLREAAEPLRRAGDRLKTFGGKVETKVERGVQVSLERLGVPSRREIQQLTSRIETLSAKIDRISV